MQEDKFLEQRIIRLWNLYKVPCLVGGHKHKAKVQLVTKKMINFAGLHNLPTLLLLNEFAFFFVCVSKEISFNKMYTRAVDFFDSYIKPMVDINNDDVEFAYNVEDNWNLMHGVKTSDFPFSFKSILLQSNIKVMKNTFFEHNNNFKYFCVLANFIRHNRKNYPQIHSMKEFFIHLPIIKKKGGNYQIWQYTDLERTLNKYYCKVYGETNKTERFDKFVSLLKDNDTLGDNKEMWGVVEMIKRGIV